MTTLTAPTFLSQYAANHPLCESAERMKGTALTQLFKDDPERFEKYSVAAAGLFLDASKNLIDDSTFADLIQLTEEAELSTAITAMFDGDRINATENRAVLHTALRNLSESPVLINDQDIMQTIDHTLEKMRVLCSDIHNEKWRGWTGKPIRHIVNIGIGGSFLGVKTVLDALKPYHLPQMHGHFVVNIDPADFAGATRAIDPESTLFIVASKSFSTLETLENTLTARQWMLEQGMPEEAVKRHFIAISSNIKAATEFGITEENIFPIWDWVGGRYSLWSAIGLMIPLMVGFDNYSELLEGAHAMDLHFLETPFKQNMPVILGLLGVWYHNYFGAQSHAVLPYDSSLETFVDHLQQVDMESNGKSVSVSGQTLSYNTGPVIWGNVGTNGQHAYHQLLHQGNRLIPVDFIVPLTCHYPTGEQHAHLVANAFAQSQALMQGKSLDNVTVELRLNDMEEQSIKALAPHKVIAGNRPSNTITMDRLTPFTMGSLIALYEHKVFVQGVIWNINSFDQWGVELGKVLGNKIFDQLTEQKPSANEDLSTQGLINKFKAARVAGQETV